METYVSILNHEDRKSAKRLREYPTMKSSELEAFTEES